MLGFCDQLVDIGVVDRMTSTQQLAQDGLAGGGVGQRNMDAIVETAGADQRFVEQVDPVRRGHDEDAIADVETVEFDQQLIQRCRGLTVLALVAAATNGVELVDEDDARLVRTGAAEQVTHPRRANTDIELDEF